VKTYYNKIIVDGVDVMDHSFDRERKMATLGEYRVGIDFNPSGNSGVNHVKQAAAALIDLIDQIPDHAEGEIKRLKALAMTDVETAAMHAVKAITKKPRE